ncbi:MAG: TIR domain-containing protein [Pseudonocardiaceae bacterium]
MARVFVSHASEDGECAAELHGWLVSEGHEVFLDRDLRDGLRVGDEWERRLHERLRWADAVVCVVTSAYLASTWCSVEVGIALSRGSRVLPVRAELGVVHPLLGSLQHADLTVDSAAGRAVLVEELRRVDAVGGWGWPDDRSPFPGLRPLDVNDHQVFFGRSSEVGQLAGLLRSPAERVEGAVLVVVGPSGCGKSSLVRAGLVHVMAGEPGWWVLDPVLPGADPVAALVRELAVAARKLGLGWTVAEVGHRVGEGGLVGLVDEVLLVAGVRRLLVVVDQFEELLTQALPAARARFAQLLYPALGGPVQVVATLRPEFFDQLLVDPGLAVLPTRPYSLRPLRRDALRAVIEGPARLAGIAVDEDLVASLVGDTDSGEALPLLAFTLAQLAEGIGRGGQLSQRRYEQLGGVRGALTHQADEALAEASVAGGRGREEVIAGLLRLVTVDEQGRPTRWRAPRDELPEMAIREVDAFVQRRLLTTDTDQGRVVVGVAHEAFLSAWAPLAQAIAENASALQARRVVEQAATEWSKEGRSPLRLWERGQLASAVADTGAHLQDGDLVTDRVELSPTARLFLRASIRRDRIRRGRALTVLSVLLVLAVVAAGIAAIQQRAAEYQRDVAVSRQIAGQALELRATNPALAAQLALAAYRLTPTTEARSSLLNTVVALYATQLPSHIGVVISVAFSPDGHTLATASFDGTARLWDVRDPHRPAALDTLTGHTSAVRSVVFSPDGNTLATASNDQTARLWDVRDLHRPAALGTLTGHTSAVYWVAFNPDGLTLATASLDQTARLWDIRDPHQPTALSTLTGHASGVVSVAFNPDGLTLATASLDQTARLWDVRDPHQPARLGTLTGHTNWVDSVAFSSDGHTLATTGRDGTARLWDVRDPRQPTALRILTGHTSGVFSVAFSPDGHTLATASNDRTARLWDLPGPIVAGHTSDVFSAVFSPDGHTLATASRDGTARLWDVRDHDHPVALGSLTGHASAVHSVAFSPDGLILATASLDHTAQLWDVRDPHQVTALGILTGHANWVVSVVFSPDGHTLATASRDGTARLWDVRDSHHPVALGTLTTDHTNIINSVVFSPDGHTLATASDDQTARLWDVRDLHHLTALGTLTGHTNAVNSVVFSPDGHTLATASADHTVQLWETNMENVIARVCNITSAITASEWDHYLPTSLAYRPPCQ